METSLSFLCNCFPTVKPIMHRMIGFLWVVLHKYSSLSHHLLTMAAFWKPPAKEEGSPRSYDLSKILVEIDNFELVKQLSTGHPSNGLSVTRAYGEFTAMMIVEGCILQPTWSYDPDVVQFEWVASHRMNQQEERKSHRFSALFLLYPFVRCLTMCQLHIFCSRFHDPNKKCRNTPFFWSIAVIQMRPSQVSTVPESDLNVSPPRNRIFLLCQSSWVMLDKFG